MANLKRPVTKPRWGSAAHVALPFFIVLGAVACNPSPAGTAPEREVYTFTGATMGTTYTLKVAGTGLSVEERHRVQNTVDARLQEVNAMMSTYDPESALSRFNQSASLEPHEVPAELMQVLVKAAKISEESGGAFDVTVGPLVNLWGFGPATENRDHIPTDMAVQKALRQVGYRKLHLDEAAGTVQKELPMMYVDLSAIAKGYGVDYAALGLEAMGYSEYMLEVGGEVRTRGKNAAGEFWRIAVEEPTPGERRVHRVVPLENFSMATSGDYRNFVEENGEILSHTIDPTTGRPIKHHLASATVLHDECAIADGYATAMMAMGPEKGLALAERLGLAVMLIVHDGKNGFTEQRSSAFEAYLATHPAE